MKSTYRKIGDHIREVNVRNKDLKVTSLLGINIDKYYMPSVANIVGTDMAAYKIVKRGQFACNRMHVGRDYRLPVALSKSEDDFIVSPAYDVFKIIDETILLPEFLMMWFSRKEFDRNAWFYTDADVRGGLPWKSFCEMEFPLPDPDKQLEIVKEYNTIVNRINLNKQLIQKLEETAQAIYKRWFVEFEFPDDKGNPYKSSGGEMLFDEELQKEVPKGWKVSRLSDISILSNTKIHIDKLTVHNYISTENMLQNRGGVIKLDDMPQVDHVTKFDVGDVLISNIRPYFKKIWLASFEGGCSNDVLCFKSIGEIYPEFLYYILETDAFFSYIMASSNGDKMPRGDKRWIMNYPIIKAIIPLLNEFNRVITPNNKLKHSLRIENVGFERILEILHSKLVSGSNY